jgi:hypothetical protein
VILPQRHTVSTYQSFSTGCKVLLVHQTIAYLNVCSLVILSIFKVCNKVRWHHMKWCCRWKNQHPSLPGLNSEILALKKKRKSTLTANSSTRCDIISHSHHTVLQIWGLIPLKAEIVSFSQHLPSTLLHPSSGHHYSTLFPIRSAEIITFCVWLISLTRLPQVHHATEDDSTSFFLRIKSIHP